MNSQSIFHQFSEELKNDMNSKLPDKIEDRQVYYDTYIQYLTSRSHIFLEYDRYALRLSLEQHEATTFSSFVETIQEIQKNKDVTGRMKPLIHSEFYSFIMGNAKEIETLFQECVAQTTPFDLTFFGWKTLYRSYLIRTHEGVKERLDHMWFRIALFLHMGDFKRVRKSFSMLRQGEATHATPTLFHAGLVNPQMASCFLVGTEDSVKGIFKTISDAAVISKHAGGLGIHISNIRGKKSYIYGTNGFSNGIMPMLRVYNDTGRYIDQCFEGSTLIATLRGIVPLSQIDANTDSVLTRDGTFRKVLKKLVHVVDKDIVEIRMMTPWKDIVQYHMTTKHDMLWYQPGTQEKSFLSLENAGFGFGSVYIQPVAKDVPYFEEECLALGFLYAHFRALGNMVYEITMNSDHAFYSSVEMFLSRYYKSALQVRKEENCQQSFIFSVHLANYKEPLSTIDFELLGRKDFPSEMMMIPLPKMNKFYQGFTYRRTEPDLVSVNTVFSKIFFMRYRMGIMEGYGKVLSIKSVPDKRMMLYDLEVEQNHNYQTMLGLAHNGGGKRKGAFAMYIEPWHSDIFDFVFARRNIGSEEERARDLFFGLWIPDEFMRRVEKDDDWYLMSENESPGLSKVWGKKFEDLYAQYISENKFIRKIKARELWMEILKSQVETGTPYILYKDTCNRFSNQQNLGTIRSSNLCCEIIEYSDEKEYAVCNLASISILSCVRDREPPTKSFWIYGKEDCFYCQLLKNTLVEKKIPFTYKTSADDMQDENEKQRIYSQSTYPIVYYDDKLIGGFKETWEQFLRPQFDFEKLGDIVETLVENLNIVIDKNQYPLEECARSNFKNRPVGIGVQGLADAFMSFLEPYDSEFSRELNRKIFETIYYYALRKSHQIALKNGPYDSFQGSPLSRGLLHFENFDQFSAEKHLSSEYDWEGLRQKIIEGGVRNSLLIAPMPTASTSQIMGNTESFEPLTSNFYLRRTLAGEFYVINKHLVRILKTANCWNENNIQSLTLDKGSVLSLNIPKSIKNVFRTVWEIPQKHLIEMAADRQMFIDQSQSFNIYMPKPDLSILTKIHFYGWKKQLKTGCYYLRTRAPMSAQNFALDAEKEKELDCAACTA